MTTTEPAALPIIRSRPLPDHVAFSASTPLLTRLYAARGVRSQHELELSLKHLLPPSSFKGMDEVVAALLPVVLEQAPLLVVGDFDVDGASSVALVLRALREMGAKHVDYVVPDRFNLGYGLTPELVEHIQDRQPSLILTVDNGIASIDGVARARELGIDVVITDHHLPGDSLPDALAIVNPNQQGCSFASPSACGCAVAFYVMAALRAALIECGYTGWGCAGRGCAGAGCMDGSHTDEARERKPPNMAKFLDLVALATVADVVALDHNNRIFVEQGLRRIRQGMACAGIKALLSVAGRELAHITAADFGFAIGPRLNAAGRLDDMSIGIECLLTDDDARAQALAAQLDAFNRDRRSIEQGMQDEAARMMAQWNLPAGELPMGLCFYQADWHQGVIGILASRIKDKTQRPVVVFARDDQGLLKGSARSIKGLHLRDTLALIDAQHPGVLLKFGGHAMAAGMTLSADGFDTFRQAFASACGQILTEQDVHLHLEVDGSLDDHELSLENTQLISRAGPWGQNFPEPVFDGEFELIQQRLVGEKHLKVVLRTPAGQCLDGILFQADLAVWPDASITRVRCVYQLDVNRFRGQENLQLLIKYLHPLG